MKAADAIRKLAQFDQKGRAVYTNSDLRTLFHSDEKKAFSEGLRRLVDQKILLRAARGVYIYGLTSQPRTHLLERIASYLRRGEYNYVSLESALSEYGRISQILMDRITVMTTGRKGEITTPFGTIEFTHTDRSVEDILNSSNDVGRPLRLATEKAALRDLRRVGRNTSLVIDLDDDLGYEYESYTR